MTFLGDQRDMWQARALKAEAEKEEYVSAYRLTNAKLIKAEEALREILRLTEIGQHCYACHSIARAALSSKFDPPDLRIVCPHCDGTVEPESCPLCHGKRFIIADLSEKGE